jgi:hypothetical protein
MAKKKNDNGIDNALTPDFQRIREQVVMDELKARHWKAQWECAFYHIEFEKILPEYEKLLKEKEAERQEFLAKQKAFIEDLQNELKMGNISVNEAGSDGHMNDVTMGDPSESFVNDGEGEVFPTGGQLNG